jgi:hypothetical protein
MKKTMGSLYTFPRRWQPKLSKLSQHFFFDPVWELSDKPHTVHYWSVGFKNASNVI